MHSRGEPMSRCIETWNRVIELDLNLTLIWSSEISWILIQVWKEVEEKDIENAETRKGFVRQILQTLNSMLDIIPEELPSHWTNKNKEDIRYLFNNPHKVLP